MLYTFILSFLPLSQFALGEELKCENNGAKKTKLRAVFDDVKNGYRYVAYCENLDDNNCPQHYPLPYKTPSIKNCQKISEGKDEDFKLINYTCATHDQIDDFASKSVKNKWRCTMIG